MTREQLETLYNMVCDFGAEMPHEEYMQHFDTFVQIKTLIHKKMQSL